jgi:mannose-6-phosphate isomerase
MNAFASGAGSCERTMKALAEELAAVRSWLIEEALPFWAATGFDHSTHSFEERLDFSGRPAPEAPRRLMVQCRQIYVFSHATLLGWFDGRDLVGKALGGLLQNYRGRVESAPFVFSVARTGEVVDPRQDSYGYAFLLIALAWARKLLGEAVDPAICESLLEHLDERLAHPSGHGFVCGLPRPDLFLRQNPQMHLFEAALEIEEAYASRRPRPLANRLYRLFRERMLLASAKALPELHDETWEPVETPEAMFEPGHHFEWIWLLDRYGARAGEPVDDLVAVLAERGYREGVDAAGAAVEAVAIRSGRRIESRRCWATCEGLKAAASDFETGRESLRAAERATRFLQALRRLFLASPFSAGWVDRVDARGAPLLDYVPASTLYHVMLAVAEADRVFGARGGA